MTSHENTNPPGHMAPPANPADAGDAVHDAALPAGGGKLTKAAEERLYILKRFFSEPGWNYPLCLQGGLKYRAIINKLVRDGHIEEMDTGGMWRITDAGLLLLKEGK